MTRDCPIINSTMELADCRQQWHFDERFDCWCLEDVLYTAAAEVPLFMRLSIFVPRAYMSAPGEIRPEGRMGRYTAQTVPVVFENNAAGYMEMPHTWLGGPRCMAEQYLKQGLIYVTCGNRGRESRNAAGEAVGKGSAALVDLKTAIRFLRHNRSALPGDWNRIISVGSSAGGAMSALLAVTGDHPDYDEALRANGAFMDESDAIYAAQIYCPVTDLEHADPAYEWMFRADKDCEDSPAGPAETMTPFKSALSSRLSQMYVRYVNGLGLTHPVTGEALTLDGDGRGGSFYDYLMGCLDDSATKYLAQLGEGRLGYTAEQYLSGAYTRQIPAPRKPEGEGAPKRSGGLGESMLRPPEGTPVSEQRMEMITVPGVDKRAWLSWDGAKAHVSGLDAYVLGYRRRMKPCTCFDKLTNDSGENHLFGSTQQDFAHFNPAIGDAIAALQAEYPEEAAAYLPAYRGCMSDELAREIRRVNPLRYIDREGHAGQASHYRIRVGAFDADTSFSVSLILALKLANAGCGTVDYALVWDQPHCQADEEGEILRWIDRICP